MFIFTILLLIYKMVSNLLLIWWFAKNRVDGLLTTYFISVIRNLMLASVLVSVSMNFQSVTTVYIQHIETTPSFTRFKSYSLPTTVPMDF